MTHLQFDLPKEQSSIIKVLGVGGGGSNAVNHMFDQGIIGVNFVVCNTDSQALDMSRIPNKIQLGPELTQGLGAGSNPEMGMKACEESVDEIRALLGKNTKMVFVTAGMGGGTGTGAAPVLARLAKEMGILTVAIVTTPFSFEGKRKYAQALEGIERLKQHVDTILIISNDKIREMYGNLTRTDAFNHANNILATAAKSISEIITVPGEINVDFADVEYVMKNGGAAIMGCASAEGEQRAIRAVQGALNSPLLNDNDVRGAKKILINITSGAKQVTIDEITEINEFVQESAKDTDIIFGTCDDPSFGEKLSVTIIATGFEPNRKPIYNEVSKKVVYELNDKPVVESKVVETPIVEVVQEPSVRIFVEEPKEEKIHEPEPTVMNVTEEEEESYSLFSTLEIEKEETENVFEFEVSRDEQVIQQEEIVQQTEEVVEETMTTTVNPVAEKKEEDEFQIYTVKSYETETTSNVSGSELNKQLDDRKKILAGLSYRFGSKGNVNELENEPAYKRKGIEVDNSNSYSTGNDVSRFSVSENGFDQSRPEIKKNNSFLHDNVD
jgi:cell division protein FtsZ